MSHILAQKIDANRRLYKNNPTLSFSSNLLLTNRSIMLVLPELVSPNNITLNVRFPMVEEVIDIIVLLFKL